MASGVAPATAYDRNNRYQRSGFRGIPNFSSSNSLRKRFIRSMDSLTLLANQLPNRSVIRTRRTLTVDLKPAMPTAQSPLHSLISTAIEKNPHLKQRKLRFEAQEGRVVLRGVVSSYYQKQMAQEALRRLEGVERIENHLEVNWL
jgi:BON domain-containing protein